MLLRNAICGVFCFAVTALFFLPSANGRQGKKDRPDPTQPGLKALKHPDANVRYKAVMLLGKLGKSAKFAVPYLKEMLADAHPAVRVKAAESLWLIERPPSYVVLPVLTKSLKENQPSVRAASLRVIQIMGVRAKKAAPAVRDALGDKDFNVRFQAVLAAGSIGTSAKIAVPELIALLRKDDTGFLEATVAVALSKIGSQAVPELSKSLFDKDEKVRRGSAYALGLIGPRAYRVVPELTKALSDAKPLIRSFAASALGKIGPDAKSAVSALQQKLANDDSEVQIASALALWRINEDKNSVPFLAKTIAAGTDKKSQRSAAEALAKIGPAAAGAVPALVRGLKSKDAVLQDRCLVALGKIGPKAKSATGSMGMLLKGKDMPLRLRALLSLWRITEKLPNASEAIFAECLKGESKYSKRQALTTLKEIGPAAKKIAPYLLPIIRDRETGLREEARTALKAVDSALAARLGIK